MMFSVPSLVEIQPSYSMSTDIKIILRPFFQFYFVRQPIKKFFSFSSICEKSMYILPHASSMLSRQYFRALSIFGCMMKSHRTYEACKFVSPSPTGESAYPRLFNQIASLNCQNIETGLKELCELTLRHYLGKIDS